MPSSKKPSTPLESELVGLESTLSDIKEKQKRFVREYIGQYASMFNISPEEALKEFFPNEITFIIDEAVHSPVFIKPKYVHPTNPELTWAGRGRIPRWMEPFLDKGQKKEDFLIRNKETTQD